MRSKSKESLIILISSITLVAIIFLMAIFIFQADNRKGQKLTYPTPLLNTSLTPTTPVFQSEKRVRFDPQTEIKLLNKLKSRQILSANDTTIKSKIISLLPQGEMSGIIYQSPNIIIDYVEPVDEFQGEILTTNIAQAKLEANSWFIIQGMSQKGICDLPLNFYPSLDVGRYLIQQNATFYSLPEGC